MKYLSIICILVVSFSSCKKTEIVTENEHNRAIHDASVFQDPAPVDVHYVYDIKGKWRTDSIVNNIMIRQNGHITRKRQLVDVRYDFMNDSDVKHSDNGVDENSSYSYDGTYVSIESLYNGTDAIIVSMTNSRIVFCFDQSNKMYVKNELHYLTLQGK